jgi:hypothetical protein
VRLAGKALQQLDGVESVHVHMNDLLARQLVQELGPRFGEKNLRRLMQFAEVFPKEEIVVSLIRQVSWTHFIALLPIKNALQLDFYAEYGSPAHE